MSIEFILLITYTAIREFLWSKERHELLDRIMSRNFEEYKDNTKPESNRLESKNKYEDLENHREDVEKWLQK